MNKSIFQRILFFASVSLSIYSYSQVGIDNALPDNNAILDMKASDKGILIPRMTTTQRFSMLTSCSPSCPNGLLVYDTNKRAFFFLDGNQWFAMMPFSSPDASSGSSEDIQIDNTVVRNVGIGMAPAAGNKLHVNGTVRVEDDLSVRNDLTVQTGNLAVSTGNISSAGNISSSGAITAVGTVRGDGYGAVGGNTFISDGRANFAGPVPRGGIIMWSGSATSIPPGWAICDGANGTPDLNGRFVMSYGTRNERIRDASGTIFSDDPLTFPVGQINGADQVILNVGEMPSHTHTGTTNTDGNHRHWIRVDNVNGGVNYDYDIPETGNNDQDYEIPTEYGGAHNHDFTTNSRGSNDKHYNVPPYYVLAYIMKL